MIHLHPQGCPCGDCRNRRVVCGLESAGEEYQPSEPGRFGIVLKANDAARERGQRHPDVGVRPIGVQRI